MEKINFTNGQAPAINDTNLNQLQTNVEDAINGIVESGSNEKGSWTKWADGTMICRCSIEETLTCNASWGNMYYGSSFTTITFPQEFIEVPNCVTDIIPADYISFIPCRYTPPVITKSSYANFDIVRPTSTSSVKVKFTVVAIGKWK